ncbi:MAG: hypothetical protein HY849_05940 [Nitrosomonadales bacterium]|nr:hypothetical protein [Nitrosomonadales bacterium]
MSSLIVWAARRMFDKSSGAICALLLGLFWGGGAMAATVTVTAKPSSCQSVSNNNTINWSNASKAKVADGSDATVSNMQNGSVSSYLQCTGYNFAVPSGAVINGITVNVTRKTDGGSMTDAAVYLVKSGNISTNMNGATNTLYTTSRSVEAHGGSTNLWGASWTVSDINNSGFGVAFSAQEASNNNNGGENNNNSNKVSVDLISIDVTYTTATSGGTGGTASYSVIGSPTSCTSDAGVGTIAWSNPGNALSSNNGYATVTGMTWGKVSNYLKCTGYNLTVPDGATITGIRVSVERNASSDKITDDKVYLVKAGTISTALNGATTTSYKSTDIIEEHGGSGNLWGTSWTAADVNSATFGVAYTAKNTSTSSTTSRTVNVDQISVEVEFSYSGTLPSGSYSMVSSPSSCASASGVGTLSWSSSSNAYASDNLYATSAATSSTGTQLTNYLKCTGFNFSVPTGSTVTGITVDVERKISSTSSTSGKDNVVSLINASSVVGSTNRATATTYTTTDSIETHGSTTDLWGAVWTAADVNSNNFGVAYSGNISKTSTSSTRTISIDQMRMRIYVKVVAAISANHVAISAANVGNTCSPSSVTITPHDAAHNRTPTWGGTIQVTTSDSKGDWSVLSGSGANFNNGTANDGVATYAFGAGESSVTLGLTHTAAGTVTVGVTDATTASSLTTNTPTAELLNTIVYSAGGFTVTDSAGNAITDMTQIAGQTSPTYYLYAVNNSCSATFTSSKNIEIAFECNDPTTCQSPVVTITNATTGTSYVLPAGMPNGTTLPTNYTSVPLSFTANSRAPFKLSYPDVGKITLYFRYSASSMLSESPPFVVKPAGLVLSNIKRSSDNLVNPAASGVSGTKFLKAGEAFTATVTAVTASGAATPNFGHEVVPETVELTPSLVSGLGLSHNPPVTGSFGAFSNGAATGTNFAWDEVGIIQLTPHIAPDASGSVAYLGLTMGGDVQGTTTGNIGRFYLGKFGLQAAALEPRADLCPAASSCPAPFVYMGEQVNAKFTLVAMSVNGKPVQNYLGQNASGEFARFDPRIFAGLNLSAVDSATVAPSGFAQPPYYLGARISNSGMPVATCDTNPCFQLDATGTQAQANVTVPFMLTKNTSPDGAYTAVNIGIAPQDADGAPVDGSASTACNNPALADCYNLDADATTGNDHALVGTTGFLYGRLRLSNGYGSERLPLPLTATLQYWDWAVGGSYVTSADDNLTSANAVLSNTLSSVANPLVFVGGVANYTLAKPSAAGSVTVTAVDASTGLAFSYLTGNSALATFGVYKGNNEFIDLREAF